ncbi:MAG TPA: dihydroorotate dehydrogenase electron transfer subunit, partial [Phycisphaerae bacterium]|nr:dihydroorotate dehydrogenase electron transfer subunit [Phycisphaerae bacterium]
SMISCPVSVSTDDGSCGYPGRVTDALQRRIERANKQEPVRVLACGPEPMLHAVASLCASRGIECEVALERVMGCGMGTCQSCVVSLQGDALGRKYGLCCRDGPVFDATKVVWGKL